MKKLVIFVFAILASLAPAAAQTPEDLAGVWTVVTIETVSADGGRTPIFGNAPLTQLILTANGRFSQFFMRSDVPKFASGNRLTGTNEENAAVVKGSNVSFGSYTVADKVVTLNMEASTFPNLNGSAQKMPVKKFEADELVWTVPGGPGGSFIETTWKRVK